MIGSRIGQLEILRVLGEGGMGAVYYAEHVVLRTPRAIKLLLPQWTQNEGIVQRFINEARAAASIRHRNIVPVHDCGQLGSSWYIVMDYLDGQSLSRFCRSHAGPIEPHIALQILAPIANGLEAAHAASIVHRDLKPDNIVLVEREHNPRHPVIVDFGIAKLGEADGGAVTRTGMMAGTPAYMAPEQMRDLKHVDRRTDVYALGLMAYQMVTGGWLPYHDEARLDEHDGLTAAEIYHRQMSRPPRDPRDRAGAITERWATAILTALHPDPARRPQTPRALALMLAEALPGDSYLPSGIEIVRTYARELLDIGNLLETVRAPNPTTGAPVSEPAARYRLGEQLGAGGMAEVFRGTVVGAEGFARLVAVKRVLPGFSTVPQFASMFVQEAQIASQLSHPNVVSVLDFDRDPEGRMFLVMEYVDGCDLSALAETGELPLSVVIFVISEVLRGLGYAHRLPSGGALRGVVHRDVSPHNVLLSWEGAVKVSDFGIAKAREASAASASTMLKGKPGYMSPEQANGEELDGRSDLFAVGVILWELLTRQRLFHGTTNETIAQVLFRPIPLVSTLRPDVPRDLEAVVMRLLERDLGARYAEAELVIEDLAQCADAPRNGRGELARLLASRFSRPVASASPSRPEEPVASTAAQSRSRDTRRERPQRPAASAMPRWGTARWGAAVVGVAAVAALTVILIANARDRGPPSRPAVAAPPHEAGITAPGDGTSAVDAAIAPLDAAIAADATVPADARAVVPRDAGVRVRERGKVGGSGSAARTFNPDEVGGD